MDGQQNAAKKANVDYSIRLPDAEFAVMKAVWEAGSRVTTGELMKAVGEERGWKAPTLISFLVRLEKRGFLTSAKEGKERIYTPVADRSEYLCRVTKDFIDTYHGGSFIGILDAIYRNRRFTDDEADALLNWLRTNYR